jgi:predicted permease
MSYTKLIIIWKQLLVLSINLIGLSGILLIGYGVISIWKNSTWEILEKIANNFSIYATLIGTVLTAISVYLPENSRSPEEASKFVVAPTVIIAVIVTVWFLLVKKLSISPHIINGFSIIAISGGLFRLISR